MMKKILLVLFIVFTAIVTLTGIYFLWFFEIGKNVTQNSFYNQLSQNVRSVVVLVPHPDDEIFVAGSVIQGFTNHSIITYIVFTTDGNALGLGSLRKKEAISACAKLGVNKQHVIFLNNVSKSQRDTTEKSGFGSKNSYNSYKASIYNVIDSIRPELIVSTDFDFNRDHRVLSLVFDDVIDSLVKQKEKKYFPIVWKGFAYQTSYNSQNDFYSLNIKSTLKPDSPQSLKYDTDIPNYRWQDRLRIPIPYSVNTKLLFYNPLFKALSSHKSQGVLLKSLNSINGDMVFWERRVPNLINYGNFVNSDTSYKYLNDFKLVHTNDITPKKDVVFSDYLWRPIRNSQYQGFKFLFNTPVSINRIYAYDNPCLTSNIISSKIRFNDSLDFNIQKNNVINGAPTLIFNGKVNNIRTIEYIINDYEGNEPGLVEFEVFNIKDEKIKVLKICDIDDNFIYNYYIDNKTSFLPFKVYSYPVTNHYTIELLNYDKNNVFIRNDTLFFSRKFNSCVLKVSLKNDSGVYDIVKIQRNTDFQLNLYKLITKIEFKIVKCIDSFEHNRYVRLLLEERLCIKIKERLSI